MCQHNLTEILAEVKLVQEQVCVLRIANPFPSAPLMANSPQAHRHLFGTCVSIHFWIPYDSNHLQLAFYKLFNSPQVFIFPFVSKLNWGHWVTETDICTCDRAQICPCSGIQLENTRIEAGGLFFSRSFLKTFLSHLLEAACGSCGKAAQ